MNKFNKFLTVSIASILITSFSCNYSNKQIESNNTVKDESDKESLIGDDQELVANSLATNCYICHNPNTKSHDEIIAPPLAGIKIKYKAATESRSDFISKMSSFVSNPTKEEAMMKGPVRRFGLMPKPNLTKEEITSIVIYIHDNKIEEPAWFEEHHQEMKDS